VANEEEKDKEGGGINGIESGTIRNGRLYEYGKIKFKNEDRYKGSFKDGRLCGYGEMRYVASIENLEGGLEGGEYRGFWKAGKRDGKGVLKYDDGSCFEGSWKCDQRIEGTMKLQNGAFYIGSFKNDRFEGMGKLFL
jgi:hypothetical protein